MNRLENLRRADQALAEAKFARDQAQADYLDAEREFWEAYDALSHTEREQAPDVRAV